MTRMTNANKTDNSKSRQTKKAQLIRMLSTRTGADLEVISGKLGWQSHTTRAAITGLRKAGFAVETAKPDADKPMRYRIVAASDTAAAARAQDSVHAG